MWPCAAIGRARRRSSADWVSECAHSGRQRATFWGRRRASRGWPTLILDESDAPGSWGEFYAAQRIDVFARRLHDTGMLAGADLQVLTRVIARVAAGDFTAEQPALVRRAGHEVARLHGDLWTGNALYDGGPTGVTEIDPMAHGGHAETDLAALRVFGFPYVDQVYAGYDAVSALAARWQERVSLHELCLVILHAYLFGGGYLSAAVRLASECV